jgi:uncharacterized protein (TIGR02284 family)
MTQTTHDLVSTLNVLIDCCKNGEKGYREAAEGVRNAYYQMRLNEYARHRATFAAELQGLVRRMGGDPDRHGTIAGMIHRGWMDLKSVIAGKNDEAVLAECCRGEASALKHYEDILQHELPQDVRKAVEKHRDAIRLSHEHLLAMKE